MYVALRKIEPTRNPMIPIFFSVSYSLIAAIAIHCSIGIPQNQKFTNDNFAIKFPVNNRKRNQMFAVNANVYVVSLLTVRNCK